MKAARRSAEDRAVPDRGNAVVALVPHGNGDERSPAANPAALASVRDEPVLVHTLRGLLGSGVVDQVILAVPPEGSPEHLAYAECVAALESVGGTRLTQLYCGAGRTQVVRSAFAAHLLDEADVVLVHDSTRPFVPPSVVCSVIDAIRAGAVSVVPVEAVTDTIKVVDEDGAVHSTHDRSRLRSVQSPYGFTPGELRLLTMDTGPGLDDGVPDAATVPGHPNAIRLSTPFDITVAEALLADDLPGGHQ
jgi:2-C-methyl-D-erythritol 4-phosphate cytidylyltransferase